MGTLQDKKVLISGGSGFIGSRLVELLYQDHNQNITALVRDFGRAMRIARLPVQLKRVDITSQEGIQRLDTDYDIIFHCAFGNKGTKKEMTHTNIAGTENLLAHAKKCNAHFVFLSTVMVYGIQQGSKINEQTPKLPIEDLYAQDKLKAEQIVETSGVPFTILQPTAVYGPFAPSYGTSIIEKMRDQRLMLVENGEGICNLVHVDDLVQAMMKAAVEKSAINETFLVSGDEACHYKELYAVFESIIGEESTLRVSKKQAYELSKKTGNIEALKRSIKVDKLQFINFLESESIKPLVKAGKAVIPKRVIQGVKRRTLGTPPEKAGTLQPKKTIAPLTPVAIEFQAMKAVVNNSKAKKILGFNPVYNLEKGLSEFSGWAQWYYGLNET